MEILESQSLNEQEYTVVSSRINSETLSFMKQDGIALRIDYSFIRESKLG